MERKMSFSLIQMQIFGLVLTIAFFQGNGLAPIRQNVAENAVVNCTIQNRTAFTTLSNPTKCIALYVLNYWWKVDLQKEFILHAVTVNAGYFNFKMFIQPANRTGDENMTSCTYFNKHKHDETYDCEGVRARYITLVGRGRMSVCTVKASSLPLSNPQYNVVYGKASQSSTLRENTGPEEAFKKNIDLSCPAFCSITGREWEPWWILDLYYGQKISKVLLQNNNGLQGMRFFNVNLIVGPSYDIHDGWITSKEIVPLMGGRKRKKDLECSKNIFIPPGKSSTFNCNNDILNRYIKLKIPNRVDHMILCGIEVEVII